jgi:hypothetical protein
MLTTPTLYFELCEFVFTFCGLLTSPRRRASALCWSAGSVVASSIVFTKLACFGDPTLLLVPV